MANIFASIGAGLQGAATLGNALGGLLGTSTNNGGATRSAAVRSALEKYSILPTNRCFFVINVPKIFTGDFYKKAAFTEINNGGLSVPKSSLVLEGSFRTMSGSLPGLQLNTSSIRRYTVGMEERNPVSAAVIDQQFTIIGDSQGIIHGFYYSWLNNIVTSNKYKATETSQGRPGIDDYRYPGSVSYREDYTSEIAIIVYDEKLETAMSIQLYNAYPVAIGDIQIGWSNSNDFMQIPVTFTFTHWAHRILKEEFTEPTVKRSSPSLLQTLSNLGSAATALSNLKRPRNIQDVLSITNNAKVVVGGLGR